MLSYPFMRFRCELASRDEFEVVLVKFFRDIGKNYCTYGENMFGFLFLDSKTYDWYYEEDRICPFGHWKIFRVDFSKELYFLHDDKCGGYAILLES